MARRKAVFLEDLLSEKRPGRRQRKKTGNLGAPPKALKRDLKRNPVAWTFAKKAEQAARAGNLLSAQNYAIQARRIVQPEVSLLFYQIAEQRGKMRFSESQYGILKRMETSLVRSYAGDPRKLAERQKSEWAKLQSTLKQQGLESLRAMQQHVRETRANLESGLKNYYTELRKEGMFPGEIESNTRTRLDWLDTFSHQIDDAITRKQQKEQRRAHVAQERAATQKGPEQLRLERLNNSFAQIEQRIRSFHLDSGMAHNEWIRDVASREEITPDVFALMQKRTGIEPALLQAIIDDAAKKRKK